MSKKEWIEEYNRIEAIRRIYKFVLKYGMTVGWVTKVNNEYTVRLYRGCNDRDIKLSPSEIKL